MTDTITLAVWLRPRVTTPRPQGAPKRGYSAWEA